MPDWVIAIVVVVVIGIAAIVAAGLRDRAVRQERARQALGPPDRVIPGYAASATAPQYLTARQAEQPPADAPAALTDTERTAIRAALAGVTPVPIGYASRDLVNDPPTGWAVLTDPLVLVCAEPVQAIRELLPVIDLARRLGAPFAVVAPAFDPVVIKTLAVNRVQRLLGVVAIAADSLDDRFTVAERTSAAVIDRSDLQAGYLPPDRVGRCRTWVSSADRTWIVSSTTG